MQPDDEPSEQTVLKAFDYGTTVDAPWLSLSEVVGAIRTHFNARVTERATRARLAAMVDDGTVARDGDQWRALVGPRLAPEVRAAADAALARGEFVELDAVDVGTD